MIFYDTGFIANLLLTIADNHFDNYDDVQH